MWVETRGMSEVAVDVDGGIAEDVLNDDVGDELVAAARDDGGSSGPMEDEDVVVHGENDVDLADDDDDDVLVTSETQDTPPKPPNAFDRLVSGTQATNTGRKGGAAGDGTASIDVAWPDLRPDGGGAKNDHAKNQNGSVSSHRLPPPDDALACPVCLEPCSVHGAHQVTSLKVRIARFPNPDTLFAHTRLTLSFLFLSAGTFSGSTASRRG